MVIDRLLGRIAGVTFYWPSTGHRFSPHFRGSEFGAEISAELSTTTTRPLLSRQNRTFTDIAGSRIRISDCTTFHRQFVWRAEPA
jgi:hypothetical protein